MPRDAVETFALVMHKLRHDPLHWVKVAFPWNEPGPLEGIEGPQPWQAKVLTQIGEGLKAGVKLDEAIRIAVASGHGVGKSALVAWITLWALSTMDDARVAVTANTDTQLRTKTWPELAKWHQISITKDLFAYTATALHSVDPAHRDTWKADALTWSENNTEAFAGLHNQGKRIVLIFDEASAIADKVWEVAEGALTDANTEIIWCAFGNPTRNTGRFRECFGSFRHRWHNQQVDSRTVSFSNKKQVEQWIADYGEDSDFVRVRVRGEFPRAGSQQFIDSERIEGAIQRESPPEDSGAPLVMGVDLARHGEDQTVIRFRRGLDARKIGPIKFRIPDLMQVASRILEQANAYKPTAIYIDGTGIGWGVVDRLRQLECQGVVGVDFGASADRTDMHDATAKYANKRAEMWGFMRDWLKGGLLDDDRELRADLEGVEYGFNARNEILLEKKDDMKKRGLASPDDGDALALTFAYPTATKEISKQQEKRYEEKLALLKARMR